MKIFYGNIGKYWTKIKKNKNQNQLDGNWLLFKKIWGKTPKIKISNNIYF